MSVNPGATMSKPLKVHSVKYNFLMTFILKASSFIFPLITFPYVSRVLHAEGNGKVAFVTSMANYFLMVASLGIPVYGIRACAQVRDDKEKLSKTVQEILLINLIATTLTVLTYVLCVFTIPKFHQEKTLFFINGINIILNMFGVNWFYQALEQYDYITIRSLVFKIISIIMMFLLVHQEQDYVIYGAITVFAAVGSNVLNFARMLRFVSLRKASVYQFRPHLKPIFVLFAQNLAVSIYTNLDTVMLGFIKTDTDVGLYHAATKLKLILLSLVTSLGTVLLPRMSYYVKKSMHTEFMETMAKALSATFMLSLPLTTYFAVFSKQSILLLAGNDYLGAVSAMQIITVAVIPNALTGILGVQVLTPLKKEKYVLYSVLVGAIVDFLLNFVTIPLWGAFGAAMSTMIAEYFVLLVQIYYTKTMLKEVKRNVVALPYVIASVIAVLPCVFIKLHSNFLELLVTATIFGGLYVLILIFVMKDQFVRKTIEPILNKLKK